MVKYLKTKKGYFYKLKKNGEKKRISQEEYNKKNKTIKNNKMIGGGRKEIIDELISKERYKEWVDLGSKFGLRMDDSDIVDLENDDLEEEGFTNRPLRYYNVDDEDVYVSKVLNTYTPHKDIIAVFEPIIEPLGDYVFPERDQTYVHSGTFKIADTGVNLTTSNLMSTVLTMIIGEKKIMAHLNEKVCTASDNRIESGCDCEPFTIVHIINGLIDSQEKMRSQSGYYQKLVSYIRRIRLKPVIYYRDRESNSFNKAIKICRMLGVTEDIVEVEYDDIITV